MNMTGCWDHKTKPSTFRVKDNEGKEVYKGPFKEGYKMISDNDTDVKQELERYKDDHARILKEWYQESAQLHQQIMELQKTSVYGLDVTRSIVTALVMLIQNEWKKRNTSEASRAYIKQSVNALRVIWGKPKNGY